MNIIKAKKEKNEINLYLKLVLHMKENGEEASEMALEFRYGQIMQDMRGIGKIIELVEMENSLMLMEMSIKVSGEMIKLMVLEYIIISMAPNILANGKMIYNME